MEHKKVVFVICFLSCVAISYSMDNKKIIIKDGKDLNKIIRARDEYKNNQNNGYSDVTRGNRINHDPTQSLDTKKHEVTKKEEI